MKASTELLAILHEVQLALAIISESESKAIPHPGKWSKIQVLGHLIDSAINNLNRFVRLQKTNDLLFEGYDQPFWVAAQNYQNSPWSEIVGLFMALNTQIAAMIRIIPEERLTEPRATHSISWPTYYRKKVGAPYSLEFLIWDYIAHLEHHLKQILPDYQPKILKA
jgi:hypothetical protein